MAKKQLNLSGAKEILSDEKPKLNLSGALGILKKNENLQPVAPIGTKPSKTGFETFQSQVDTEAPSILTTKGSDEYKEQKRIGERFKSTLLNVPTEFGKVANFMDAAKKVKDTLPQTPEFRKVGEIPKMQPTQMTEGQRLGESLTKGTDVRELITDKLTGKKTGLQKQLESAQAAFRGAQGEGLAEEIASLPTFEQRQIQPVVETGYENIAPFMGSLNSATASFYKIPKYLYSVFAMPQNFASALLDIPELKADYDTISKGTYNPLGILDRIGDYSLGKSAEWEAKQRKYNEGISTQLATGDWGNAGLQIYDNIIASVPSIASMYLSGGAASAAKLGSINKTLATALPFAAAQNEALEKNENIPAWLKPVNAAANAISEVIFEERFGTKAILDGLTKIAKTQGKDIAEKSAKDVIYNYIKKVLSKVQPVTDVVANSTEEMATRMSQNIIAKVTGEDPNRNIMDGVADAGIVGGAQGAGASAIRKGLDVISNKKSKTKVEDLSKKREDLVNDLENNDLPDSVKEQIESKLEDINVEINDILDSNRAEVENLPEGAKAEISDLSDRVESIKESLQNENISDTTRSILEEDLKAAEAELDAKFKVPQPTFDTEESIGEEIRESNRKFQAEEIDQATWEQEQKDLNKRAENIIPVPEDAEIGKPEEVVSEDVEAKKAEIETDASGEFVPKKYTLNERGENPAPNISVSSINLQDSGLEDLADVKQVKLLEIRGKNSEGKTVGRVFIQKQDGSSFDAEVFFNDAELAVLEQQTKPKEDVPALKDVESTTKALGDIDKESLQNEIPLVQLEINGYKRKPSEDYEKGDIESISKAYHIAKADGSNPELVKAVEDLLTPKPTQDAIQEQAAGQVPVLTEAKVGEEVEQGEPEAKPKGVTEEGVKAEEVTPAQQVEQLRADEQAELKTALPNAEQYLTDGKVDRTKITDAKDLKKFDEIYDKYDKLITPLLPKKEAPAKAKPLPKPRVATRLAFKKAVDLFYDISGTEGSSKKRTLSAKRKTFLEQNPSIKYIDDNWKDISKQLEEKGLITKKGNCP